MSNGAGIERIPADSLHLDPENPRLPEDLQGGDADEVFEYIYMTEDVDELINSMLDNGYFEHEPLIVREREDGDYVVLEGNRRLAALMVIHERPEAADVPVDDYDVDDADREALSNIPCSVVEDRDQVRKFLGYRHIGGLKKWSAEAKARYIAAEVWEAVDSGADRPFREVGRRLGSNARGVRNSYRAMRLLEAARDEYDINVNHVKLNRFGVWQRAMNSAEIRDYIGFGDPRSYEGIEDSIEELDEEGLREVIGDLTPAGGEGQAVLKDSRQVTVYGRVLANERARQAKRKHGLGVARQIVQRAAFPQRVRSLAEQCDAMLDEVHDLDINNDVQNAVQALFEKARTLRAIVDDLSETEE